MSHFTSHNQSLTAENGIQFRFGQNSDGEYGYIINKDGADTVIPFKLSTSFGAYVTPGNYEYTIEIPKGISRIYWEKIIYGSATCDSGAPALSGTAYVSDAETLQSYYVPGANSRYLWYQFCSAKVKEGTLRIENNKNGYGGASGSWFTYPCWTIVGV